jgi:hypothetical protein
VQRLIAAINEQLWVGHFDIWTHTGMIMYRQALVLPGGLTGLDIAMRGHAGRRHPRLRALLPPRSSSWSGPGKTAADGR